MLVQRFDCQERVKLIYFDGMQYIVLTVSSDVSSIKELGATLIWTGVQMYNVDGCTVDW